MKSNLNSITKFNACEFAALVSIWLFCCSVDSSGIIEELEKRFGVLSGLILNEIEIEIERYILILGFQRSIGMRNKGMLTRALARKDYSLENKLKGYDIEADTELMDYINRANDLLFLFEQVERMKSIVMSLKQPTISEVRSYSNPPAAIQNVMEATYVLIGEEKKKLKVRKYWEILYLRILLCLVELNSYSECVKVEGGKVKPR